MSWFKAHIEHPQSRICSRFFKFSRMFSTTGKGGPLILQRSFKPLNFGPSKFWCRLTSERLTKRVAAWLFQVAILNVCVSQEVLDFWKMFLLVLHLSTYLYTRWSFWVCLILGHPNLKWKRLIAGSNTNQIQSPKYFVPRPPENKLGPK